MYVNLLVCYLNKLDSSFAVSYFKRTLLLGVSSKLINSLCHTYLQNAVELLSY